MNEIKIVIPIAPVTKKNHQQIFYRKTSTARKPFVMPSEQYRAYAGDAAKFIPRRTDPIDYPVNVKCLFYMPTKRRVDLVNLLQSACDVLVYGGFLKDDNSRIVASHDGSRVLIDKDNPRTEIYITEE